MDKIVLKNLVFYGYHGVLPAENVLGQKFMLDLELAVDLHKPGFSDEVEDTVSYAQVYGLVKQIVEQRRFKLIEALAQCIASSILDSFSKVQEVCVDVKKPGAPVQGTFDYFGVNISRKRAVQAYLGLGSNLGNKKLNIDRAVQLLQEHMQIIVTRVSSYYETEPVGYKEQDWFINAVVEIETSLDPYDLLKYCNQIEKELKRERIIRWGPRIIDVDILLYDNFRSDDRILTIPHPRMTERAFVMIPLLEIAPHLEINGKHIKAIVADLKGEEIKKMEQEGAGNDPDDRQL